jgi:SAM-dependent methyltransferase
VHITESRDLTPSYWDEIIDEFTRAPRLDAWRQYMRGVYLGLMDGWLPVGLEGGLKTDLFEEAVTPHALLPQMGLHSFGIDCSPAIALAAKRRLEGGTSCRILVGDLRHLPIRSSSLQYVLSGSSLDHFHHHDDIALCLAELHRVLEPGAPAIFTFDNPHNPVVWLRNHLPFKWLNQVHLVPYYVGATYTRKMARQQLEAAGFEVMGITAVVHAPRAPVIGLLSLLERLGWRRPATVIPRLLDAFEKLQYLPTRYRTGCYIACHARNTSSQ